MTQPFLVKVHKFISILPFLLQSGRSGVPPTVTISKIKIHSSWLISALTEVRGRHPGEWNTRIHLHDFGTRLKSLLIWNPMISPLTHHKSANINKRTNSKSPVNHLQVNTWVLVHLTSPYPNKKPKVSPTISVQKVTGLQNLSFLNGKSLSDWQWKSGWLGDWESAHFYLQERVTTATMARLQVKKRPKRLSFDGEYWSSLCYVLLR